MSTTSRCVTETYDCTCAFYFDSEIHLDREHKLDQIDISSLVATPFEDWPVTKVMAACVRKRPMAVRDKPDSPRQVLSSLRAHFHSTSGSETLVE